MLDIFTHKHRTKALAWLVIAIVAVFIVRSFHLQVVRHDHYKRLADSGQIKKWVLPAVRGKVFFSNGNNEPSAAVLNKATYTVWADPKSIEQGKTRGDLLGVLRTVAPDNVRDNVEQLLDKTDTQYQVIAKNISYAQAEEIKSKNIYGIGFQLSSQRVYPEEQLGSQILGFVNADGLGQYGVEGGLDKVLRGQDGVLRTVTDVREVPLTIGNKNVRKPAVNGSSVVLSIDRNVQRKAEEVLESHVKKLGAQKASAIVMNPQTGKVMAMANYPSYNAAERSKVTDITLFNNPIISTPLEPGSVIKTFTVASALDKGVISPTSTYYNTDFVQVGDRTITNVVKGQNRTIGVQDALNLSLNTGMVDIMRKMGGGSINRQSRDMLYDYFTQKYHFNGRTGVELMGEAGGFMHSPDEVQGNAVRYSNMAFGQGMNVTMMQVASGFCPLVNGGIYYEPSVVDYLIDENEEIQKKNPVSSRALNETAANDAREMVHKARKAFYASADTPGYYVGGKTGTSQVLKNNAYTFDETIGTYLGFGGEVDKPSSYVIMVQVSGENMNLKGNVHAMPIFTDISNWMIKYLQLQPKG